MNWIFIYFHIILVDFISAFSSNTLERPVFHQHEHRPERKHLLRGLSRHRPSTEIKHCAGPAGQAWRREGGKQRGKESKRRPWNLFITKIYKSADIQKPSCNKYSEGSDERSYTIHIPVRFVYSTEYTGLSPKHAMIEIISLLTDQIFF